MGPAGIPLLQGLLANRHVECLRGTINESSELSSVLNPPAVGFKALIERQVHQASKTFVLRVISNSQNEPPSTQGKTA